MTHEETHRPRPEPENTEIHREFPADAAQERAGIVEEGEKDAPNRGAEPAPASSEGARQVRREEGSPS